MIVAPCSVASWRRRAASCLASASWARYCSRICVASACASAARSRPPSIASCRSSRVFWMLGRSFLPRTPKTMKKQIRPTINSAVSGMRGFSAPASARKAIMSEPFVESGYWSSAAEDEGNDQAEQRQHLTEREAQEHVGADDRHGLGLTGHGLDGVTEDQTDADAGADGGETVGDRAHTTR